MHGSLACRRPLLAVYGLALFLALGAHAQMTYPDMKPVPPELLQGRALVVPELNMRVEAPGKYWSWHTVTHPSLKGARSFACKKGETGLIFVVTVNPGSVWKIDSRIRNDLRRAAEQQIAASYSKLLEYTNSEVDVPGPGSLRIDMTFRHPIGFKFASESVAYPAGNLYILEAVWVQGGPRPADFDGFLRSFALLRPASRSSTLGKLPWELIVAALVLGLACSPGVRRGWIRIALGLGGLVLAWSMVRLAMQVTSLDPGQSLLAIVLELRTRAGGVGLAAFVAVASMIVAFVRLLRADSLDMPPEPLPYDPGPAPFPPTGAGRE